jgi:hypothetical protein
MQTAFETIRALRTRFAVVKSPTDEFILNVDEAELGDVRGPATLKFFSPTHAWAAVWDDASSEWRDVIGFALPAQGEINEAFVKSVGHRLKVSFTDKKTPLLRWGFTATNVEVTAKQ